jgi:hypothetical protein
MRKMQSVVRFTYLNSFFGIPYSSPSFYAAAKKNNFLSNNVFFFVYLQRSFFIVHLVFVSWVSLVVVFSQKKIREIQEEGSQEKI